VAHLSNQFKKITGLSPSQFKQLKDKSRSPIENIGMLDMPKRVNGTDKKSIPK
jgi:hypothetical protein